MSDPILRIASLSTDSGGWDCEDTRSSYPSSGDQSSIREARIPWGLAACSSSHRRFRTRRLRSTRVPLLEQEQAAKTCRSRVSIGNWSRTARLAAKKLPTSASLSASEILAEFGVFALRRNHPGACRGAAPALQSHSAQFGGAAQAAPRIERMGKLCLASGAA